MTNNKLIKLYSKDKNSLKRFIQLLNKINKNWKDLTFVSKNIKKSKKKVTVLKSPHVNKTAQTQFQAITYGILIKYSATEVKKNYIMLKKIRNHLFPDVKIKIEQTIFSKKTNLLLKNRFFPKKVHYYGTHNIINVLEKQKQKNHLLNLSSNKENKKILLKKTLQFLKILDHYGSST